MKSGFDCWMTGEYVCKRSEVTCAIGDGGGTCSRPVYHPQAMLSRYTTNSISIPDASKPCFLQLYWMRTA